MLNVLVTKQPQAMFAFVFINSMMLYNNAFQR